MKTYIARLTLPIAGGNIEEQELGFATHLGYKPTVQSMNEQGDIVDVPNEQTPEDFIKAKAKEHMDLFTSGWANSLVDKYAEPQIQHIKEELHEQLVQPVIDSIEVTVE